VVSVFCFVAHCFLDGQLTGAPSGVMSLAGIIATGRDCLIRRRSSWSGSTSWIGLDPGLFKRRQSVGAGRVNLRWGIGSLGGPRTIIIEESGSSRPSKRSGRTSFRRNP
jgi:hypothetical protein